MKLNSFLSPLLLFGTLSHGNPTFNPMPSSGRILPLADALPELERRGISPTVYANATKVEFLPVDSDNSRMGLLTYHCISDNLAASTTGIAMAANKLTGRPPNKLCLGNGSCKMIAASGSDRIGICGPDGVGVPCNWVGWRFLEGFLPACEKGPRTGGYMRYTVPGGTHVDFNAYH